MKQQVLKKEYRQGRSSGLIQGKAAGYQQGLQDARVLRSIPPQIIAHTDQPQEAKEVNHALITEKFYGLGFDQHFKARFGNDAELQTDSLECLKKTFKSSIWKFDLQTETKTTPVILKTFTHPSAHSLNEVELNVYMRGHTVLQDLMPQIYIVQQNVNGNDTWVFMEFVTPITGQVDFAPKYFDSIIPMLAKFHAVTYEENFYRNEDVFMPWMPMYNIADSFTGRKNSIDATIRTIDKAMDDSKCKKILTPVYDSLMKALKKGPTFFPALIEAGQSMTHNDLQTNNIGCNNLVENEPWPIKFLDWEGTSFQPCWIDLFNLVGVFLQYRSDWRNEEDRIFEHCARLYAEEMKKYDITFEWDSLQLFKMAYLQRSLEKNLLLQLNWKLKGNIKGGLLEDTVDKINHWGKELGLI